MAIGSLFSSSSSADTRGAETGQQTAGPGSPALSLSNVDVKRNSDLNLNVELADFGAIDAAFQYGGEASLAALDAGAEALDAALLFSGEAGAAANRTTESALAAMAANTSSVIQTSEALSNSAVIAVQDSQDNAFEFAAGGVMAGFDASRDALDSVSDAYRSATEASQIALITSLDAADRQSSQTLAVFDKATSAIERANQSETAKLSEQLVYGAMALVAFMAWRASA